MKEAISRRQILLTTSSFGLLAMVAGPVLANQFIGLSSQRVTQASWIGHFFSSPESARRIGHLYLKYYPDIRELTHLEAECRVNHHNVSSRRSIALQRQRIAGLIRHDFEQERTVNLDGWILSITEAQVCALFVSSQ